MLYQQVECICSKKGKKMNYISTKPSFNIFSLNMVFTSPDRVATSINGSEQNVNSI